MWPTNFTNSGELYSCIWLSMNVNIYITVIYCGLNMPHCLIIKRRMLMLMLIAFIVTQHERELHLVSQATLARLREQTG